MPTTILTTDTFGTNLTYTFNTAGNIFVLAAGTRLVGSGYSYLYGTVAGVNVTVDGYAWLEGNAGSPFYFAGNDRITIGPDAQMVLTSNASFAAVTLGVATGGTDFANYGHITTLGGAGVSIGSGNNSIRNHGTIDVTTGKFNFGGGGGDALLNAGTITGRGSPGPSVIVHMNGINNTLTNTGDILSNTSGTNAVLVEAGAGTNTIGNSGDIRSEGGIGILSLGSGSVTVSNSGIITGQFGAIALYGLSNTVTNTGNINGNVTFGEGSDTFRGIGGTVTGSIAGGAGADTYYTSDPAMTIVEAASGGADTVYAATSFRLADHVETLRLLGFAATGVGNLTNNVIIGNAADNRLLGLAGTDHLLGGEGDDVIGGGDGNDTLQGGDGNDWLRGAVGNDSLTAGGENDTLIGAAGADTLHGGTGNDSFIFVRQTDSGATAPTSDLIVDFVRGEDVIDLAGVDARTTNGVPNDAFTFIGTAVFSNVAGQLRYGTAAGVTTLQMDVNGNGTADTIIRLTGTLTLTAQDFVL